MTDLSPFGHEQLVVRRGSRSRLPIVVAVHSTVRGPAVGGCRVWRYPSWQEAVDDALRLSEAMSLKCAVANLAAGGGKSVIALDGDQHLDRDRRRAALLDLGDIIADLDGVYITGEDVGTTADDMQVIRERTEFVAGLPTQIGGIGEPSEPTAAGVYEAILVTLDRILGSREVAGRRFTVIGLGQVGSRLAIRLAAAGGRVTVTDLDRAKADLAREIGARWVEPQLAHTLPTDVLVPAGVGGLLTEGVVEELKCLAVVGPANNQLNGTGLDVLLASRRILWAPDFVVSAGGVIFGLLATAGASHDEVMTVVGGIGTTLLDVYNRAEMNGATPLEAANEIAAERLGTDLSSAGGCRA